MASFLIGCLAQLVEHRPYKARVVGSNPTAPTTIYNDAGVVVQLVRIPACHAGGRGFEPRPLRQFFLLPYTWLFPAS
jgi:hypothetical protein